MNNSMIIKDVVVADDHDVVRIGLISLLESKPDFQVVGEAADGIETLEITRKTLPDALVLDLMMPGMNGIDVIRALMDELPRLRIVVCSMYGDDSHVTEAVRLGARGYLLKDSVVEHLVLAVRRVCAGGRYFSPTIYTVLCNCRGGYAASSEPADRYDLLTMRERQVFHLAAEGLSNAEIADRLLISRRTVEVHRASMTGKLNLHGAAELVRYAIGRGVVSPV
ncbi:MAG: response regulator transcription factor [Nitrospirae bacterium]|nr:response regulator transcription factor [Nitrospirota bacterium]